MKVLVIDDDEKSRKLLSILLTEKNIEIVQATNYKDAFDKISQDVKFCFCDINLPEVSGYEIAKQIKGKYPQIPVVAYTANVLPYDCKKLEQSKIFDAVLLKPSPIDEISKVIDKFMKQSLSEKRTVCQLVQFI